MMNKKGLSAVVATLLLVLLAIVLVGIIWTVVTNLTQDKLNEASSCLNIFEKVTFEDSDTCYDITSKELQFSVGITNVAVDKILIGISAGKATKSIEIKAENSSSPFMKPYGGSYNNNFALPDENGRLTYVYNMSGAGFSVAPDSISIIPVVSGSQCGKSDDIFEIYNC